MNCTQDKIKHYKVAYSIAKTLPVLGFLLVVLILAPGKEFFDAIRPNHKCEWGDYKAGVIGAWDGLIRRRTKF